MTDAPTADSEPLLLAPSPTVLDIYVVWHPDDQIGAGVFEELLDHYHSDQFSGLAGSAIEVFCRSRPLPDRGGALPPIITADGNVDGQDGTNPHSPTPFTVIIPVIGRNMVKASQDGTSRWHEYLEGLHGLVEPDGGSTEDPAPRVLVHPILERARLGHANAPLIGSLTERQCLVLDESAYAPGALARDIGQAIIQRLLWEQKGDGAHPDRERLTVFLSHARGDIPESDKTGIVPRGIVAKVEALARKTHLDTFLDVHDLQANEHWDTAIRDRARTSALLMVRTDMYSSREWTQWEVFEAKQAEAPVVCLSALTKGEARGSFLLDHVPTVAYPQVPQGWGPLQGAPPQDPDDVAIINALNRLVDETLKFALWRRQVIPERVRAASTGARSASATNHCGFDSAPPTAPEPTVLLKFIQEHKERFPGDKSFWLIHPDPPLLPAEHAFMTDLCVQAGYEPGHVHLLTPRSFFAAGGKLGGSEPELTTPVLSRGRPLAGKRLGVSMALSDDLALIGLSPKHLESAIAEVSQMMLLGGGSVVYAGAPGTHVPDLTTAIMNTVARYVTSAKALVARRPGSTGQQDALHHGDMFALTVPCTSLQSGEAVRDLVDADYGFADIARITVLDEDGDEIEPSADLEAWQGDADRTARALSRIRSALPRSCDARLVIGGKTRKRSAGNPDGYFGDYPGIIEEALHTVRAGQPLFVAGGFGGAAALLAHELGLGPDLPIRRGSLSEIEELPRYRDAVAEIKEKYDRERTGLGEADLWRLATTQRASELGALLVKGLAAPGAFAGTPAH